MLAEIARRAGLVDFRNTLIVMTSNLGWEYLVSLGEDQDVDQVREQVMNVERGHSARNS